MLEELILAHRDYYGGYHHHKEQMAYTAATLYLGAATTVVIQGSKVWSWDSVCLVALLLVGSATVGFAFVGWQLYQRAIAANIVMACTTLATRLLAHSGESAPNISATAYRGLTFPQLLVDELKSIDQNRTLLGGPRMSAALTLLAMFLWSVAAFIAIYCAPAAP